MPRTPIDLDRFRAEIEDRLLVQKQRQKDVVEWLAEQGCKTTTQTLVRRCRQWGASHRVKVPSNDPALIAEVQEQYSSTFDNDTTIAKTLNAKGIPVSRSQVKHIRLRHGWHRRTIQEADRAEAMRETFNRVKQAIDEGVVRPHNREAIRKALMTHYHYHAREGDVREALKVLNPEGITARKPEFNPPPTNDRIVDFAFDKINEALLAPFGAIGAIGSTPEASEEVRTILHNLLQFGQTKLDTSKPTTNPPSASKPSNPPSASKKSNPPSASKLDNPPSARLLKGINQATRLGPEGPSSEQLPLPPPPPAPWPAEKPRPGASQ